MEVVGLVYGFVCSIVYVTTRPLVICISSCLFCLKTALITLFMSADLLSSAICFHVNMLLRAVLGTLWGLLLLLTLPIRFFAFIPRERLLEQSMYEMHCELENLEWNREEIEKNLQAAINEYRVMESELAELAEDHNEAISKIEKLEIELQDLKEENLRLKEVQGKGHWSTKGHAEADKDPTTSSTEGRSAHSGTSASKSRHDQHTANLQATRPTKIPHGQKRKADGTVLRSPPYPFGNDTVLKGEGESEVIGSERGIALSRSIFSAVLSVLVGLIISEAKQEDLCTPLVGALFTVVGISLKSVVQFFSSVKNKPASDAVALMSLNWFILGTLTYPTLPRMARTVAPALFSTTGSVLTSIGRTVPS
ncbi:PREDICTED: uncharacterized protein LOC104811203 [Tarenaya hassleriana]|uniref:uncharacterized protein LOC104811203 n=1 Tax=Tarenaya hassleriana TaxID=28532 RepID=UPI00053C52C3|nr:PREDICTED: uncharacterized protein LOC104811203 [Tarenaya hassleriana]XP_010536152.1 PREDICTED: uncharacterized protein LOC104811203 [Tarenaya hassleriana]XP_010536158.1 PREDICTED: uncharacterized protein LOC104811203 [Tarenaya hassleriana]